MRRALIQGGIFLLVLAAVLFGLQSVLDAGLRKSRMQWFASWNDIYASRAAADMIIIGDSRAKLSYSPRIIDSITGINTYNIGVNGAMLPMQLARLKIYLQHNPKPKYILQNVDFYLFSDFDHLVDEEQFIPYLGDSVLRNVARQYAISFTTPELYLPAFKYNNHLNLVKEGILCYLGKGHRATNSLYKGYGGVSTPFNNFFAVNMAKDPDDIRNGINDTLAGKFRDYLSFCHDNGIQLIFVYGPVMKEAACLMQPDTSKVTRLLMQLAKEFDIPYLSYVNDSIGNDQSNFIDHVHLSTRGSEVFSRKVAMDLRDKLHVSH